MEQKKKLINGGDVLIKCFLQEGIEYMFGIPGGQLLNVYDAVYRWGRENGINTVLFRHEQAAAHAADAYARVTNKPGVCFGTVGPGALHLVPGVGTAWSDNIPLVVLVPQVNSKYADSFTLQGNLDQITMFKPITKYQKTVRKIEEIPYAVQKAFREAVGNRPGPVLLEIYEDAFLSNVEEKDIPIVQPEGYRAIFNPSIDDNLIIKSLDLLLKAKRPLIVSGGGVARAEAWNELKELAEYLQIPVITTFMGIGTISNESKCLIGSSMGNDVVLQAARRADVVLALGCRFTFVMGHGMEPYWKNSQKLIQVDIDPSMIGRNKPITLGIVGDCKKFLEKIVKNAKNIKQVENRQWLDKLILAKKNSITSIISKASKASEPINSRFLVSQVFEFMDEDAILIADGGEIEAFTLEQINLHKPRPPLSTLISACMGHLGVTIPYGLGAKLAKPEKQVIAIAGDGAFMFNVQDLETAVRLGLKNLIYVVSNNNAWGSMKSFQKFSKKKHYIDVDFSGFNYAACAEGFGCYGERVTKPNDIKPALERAKNSNKPAVIDVIVKYETHEITRLLQSAFYNLEM
ncbi:MAG: thiamine pyrophosphate-binding protein [Promethearchaeota archaeon]|nr:MAG: thiamine pyrophosphate-binding protein [Candidatus Lokiarchaeota archaeon]